MDAIADLAMFTLLGLSVGIQWGLAPAFATVSAVYLLMPYKYTTTR